MNEVMFKNKYIAFREGIHRQKNYSRKFRTFETSCLFQPWTCSNMDFRDKVRQKTGNVRVTQH